MTKNKGRRLDMVNGRGEERTMEFVSAIGQYRCPCGQIFDMDQATGAVMHTMPMCNAFERLEPSDFIKWARENGARPVQ